MMILNCLQNKEKTPLNPVTSMLKVDLSTLRMILSRENLGLENYITVVTLRKGDHRSLPFQLVHIVGINFLHRSLPHSALESFFNLIKSQFQLQPAVPGKDSDPERFPNEGRKVLLFSDSRQRAAKLARDMSDASDISAARQLFAIAIKTMEEQTVERSMNTFASQQVSATCKCFTPMNGQNSQKIV